MKRKTVLSLSLIFALFFTAVPMTAFAAGPGVEIATAFPDANFRAYVEERCDTNKDGYLSTAEINAVTYLEVQNKGIQSLKGVELFTNLKNLKCFGNELTALDVSKNVALEDLRCSENELTSLDVSKNVALEDLRCSENELTSLDVSKNVALKDLRCGGNKLKTLNLSKNTLLEVLYCGRNELTALDVTKSTKLLSINCPDNKLTTLDVSKNVVLDDLCCNYNNLKTLNVSKNTLLEVLYCGGNELTALDVTKNTKLLRIECADNKLTTLDVSKNALLYDLDCGGNKLTSLDVSKNTALERLYCEKNQLTTLNLGNLTSLEVFYCNDNKLTSLDVSRHTNLSVLGCEGNQLTTLNLGNTSLWLLYCNDNKLTSLDLSKQASLSDLNCKNNQLTALNVSKNYNLGKLDCSANKLTSLNASNNTILRDINCADNKLTALNVSKSTELEYLSCWDNQLTSLDVSKNTALKTLYCSNNKITSLTLGSNTTLESLECEDNQLTTLDVSQNTALTSIHCPNNKLASLDVSQNTALKLLYCENNKLTALDVRNIPELEELYCQNNQLTSLQLNRYLAWLDCSGNKLTSLDLSNVSYLSYMNISPKIDMVKSSNGNLSVNLGQLEDYITFSSETSLANATGISGYFAKDANSFYEGSDYEPTFDRNTLIATWTKDQLGENRYCFNVGFGVVGVAHLRFEVNQDTGLPTPVVTKGNDSVTGKPKLTWKAVSGAAKYEIYRYDSASNTYVKMISTTGTTFTNTSAVAGKTYSYKVKAIGSSSSMTSITAPISVTCKYPTPKVVGSNNPATGKNVLNWAKVTGATKYEIYRYDSASSSYIKLITTSGTTFTNTSAKPGYIYYYKVKAIGSVAAAASNFSDKVKLTCKYPTPKVVGSNNPVTGKNVLNWEKVDGATKYEIYRYDSASNSYIKLITTTGTTFTNTSAKPGYIYYYKVKAIGSVAAAASNFSDKVKLTCKCAAPKVTGSTNPSTGKPKLTWNAVAGATKYEVYRYDSTSNTYVKYYTTTATSFNNTSAQTGVTYYYKVKALGATTASDSATSEKVKVTCK